MAKAIGAKIKQIREERGWTQGQLALYAGVSIAYVSRLEAEKFARPSGKMLSKIARALAVPVETLIEGEKPEIDLEDARLRFFVDELSRLSPNDREIVYGAIEAARKRKREHKQTE
jgi:transcriptional regulator with XRE-family HTH domain